MICPLCPGRCQVSVCRWYCSLLDPAIAGKTENEALIWVDLKIIVIVCSTNTMTEEITRLCAVNGLRNFNSFGRLCNSDALWFIFRILQTYWGSCVLLTTCQQTENRVSPSGVSCRNISSIISPTTNFPLRRFCSNVWLALPHLPYIHNSLK